MSPQSLTIAFWNASSCSFSDLSWSSTYLGLFTSEVFAAIWVLSASSTAYTIVRRIFVQINGWTVDAPNAQDNALICTQVYTYCHTCFVWFHAIYYDTVTYVCTYNHLHIWYTWPCSDPCVQVVVTEHCKFKCKTYLSFMLLSLQVTNESGLFMNLTVLITNCPLQQITALKP